MVESLLTALGREKARCHFFSRGWRDERIVERGAKKGARVTTTKAAAAATAANDVGGVFILARGIAKVVDNNGGAPAMRWLFPNSRIYGKTFV